MQANSESKEKYDKEIELEREQNALLLKELEAERQRNLQLAKKIKSTSITINRADTIKSAKISSPLKLREQQSV